MYKLCRHLHRVVVVLVFFSGRKSWASSRETIKKMFFGKQFWQSGAFCHRRDNHSHIYKNIGVAQIRITKSWGTKEYWFLYKKSVTGKEKSLWKLESFLENRTTFKVLMRSTITFYFIF